jgi:hypothetical protein
VSTGFRSPTAYEVAATPTIKTEFHHSKELGLVYAVGKTYARAVYFETRADDAISVDDDTLVASNLARTENKGLEVSMQSEIA